MIHKISRTTLAVAAGTLISLTSSGEGREWNAAAISPTLTRDADAVVRLYEQEVEVISPTRVRVREHLVVTVLNEAGKKVAHYQVMQSGLNKVNALGGALYDQAGKQLDHVKSGDFRKMPIAMISSMYAEDVIRAHEFPYSSYPYTVEYSSEQEQNHTFVLPAWAPQESSRVSLAGASLKVTVPPGFTPRYKAYNTGIQPVITPADGNTTYTWKLENISAFHDEPMAPELFGGTPVIVLAAKQFSLNELSGDMDTWQHFGSFIYQLNKGRDSLPESVRSDVQLIARQAHSAIEKISLLYRYMQEHTRYVAVEFGVGGWRTLEASFIAKNQYGDCKGLSNYMMALLREAGITSYPVLIHAGGEDRAPIAKDFPSTCFNHEILCVPQGRDTVWLECTSHDLPAGYLGDFTHNRNALMVTPGGGVVVHTPAYDGRVNQCARVLHADMGEENRFTVRMNNFYCGEEVEAVNYKVRDKPEAEVQEYVSGKFNLGSYAVTNYQYEQVPGPVMPGLREVVTLSVAGHATTTGSRSFVNIDFAPPDLPAPATCSHRTRPFILYHSTAEADTFYLKVGTQYEVESLPEAEQARFPFGSYSCSVTKKGDEVVLIRSISLYQGTYPADQYNNFTEWLDRIKDERSKKVVLKSKA